MQASCPRWFFPLAPYASQEQLKVGGSEATAPKPERKKYRDALCGRQMSTFNTALCGYYHRHCRVKPMCPPDDGEVGRTLPHTCADFNQNCLSWARKGECDANPSFMRGECAQSCRMCGSVDSAGAAAEPDGSVVGDGTPEVQVEMEDGTVMNRAFLGEPERTCVDEEPLAACVNLVDLGACETQRGWMQESCRRSCEFCNASRAAFADGNEPKREDTAAHACPDGTWH